MQVQPYLFFDGRCDEALDFYKKAVGAKVEMLMRLKENPDQGRVLHRANEDKIMHAAVKVGDTRCWPPTAVARANPEFKGFALTISAKTEAEADKMFGALSRRRQSAMPLTKTFFSPKFGMLADKFGVGWMVMVDR